MTAPPLKLGYVLIESNKLEDWRQFAAEGLGLHVEAIDERTLVFRLDDYARRFIVRRGRAEDVIALGWETADLEAMRKHLSASKVKLDEESKAAAELRGVTRYISYAGPKGLRMEFSEPPRRTNAPLNMKATHGFNTGDGGLGHAVMTTRFPEKLQGDFERLLGARLSDTITDKLQGIEMEFSFFHLNERHHSLAIAATKGLRIDPLRKRIQHLMIESRSLEDVTAAYERCKRLGYRIAMGMGQHPNDKAKSFYVVSPSGVEFEMGCETIRVEDATAWEPQSYRGISEWGHQPEFKPTFFEKMAALWNALTSLTRKDHA